jgi:hypothetical protein
MATRVRLGKVSGIIRTSFRKRFKKNRVPLETGVRKAVDGWFDGAFVGVAYPTGRFPHAYDTFTGNAAADARRQKGLMTNWKLGHHIDGVTTQARAVTLDVLAPRGHAAAVTAHVRLRFATTGHKEERVTVTGRLFLTRNPNGKWRIFGYDVSKGAK